MARPPRLSRRRQRSCYQGRSPAYAYCVHELRLSEDAAFERIRAARTARRFPALFAALAEGRLHLSGLVLLASHLTPENADELLAAAAHRSKAEITPPTMLPKVA